MINDPVMLTADFLHVNILSPPAGNATSACVSTSGFFEAKCGMETGVLITSFFAILGQATAIFSRMYVYFKQFFKMYSKTSHDLFK